MQWVEYLKDYGPPLAILLIVIGGVFWVLRYFIIRCFDEDKGIITNYVDKTIENNEKQTNILAEMKEANVSQQGLCLRHADSLDKQLIVLSNIQKQQEDNVAILKETLEWHRNPSNPINAEENKRSFADLARSIMIALKTHPTLTQEDREEIIELMTRIINR